MKARFFATNIQYATMTKREGPLHGISIESNINTVITQFYINILFCLSLYIYNCGDRT